MPGRRQRFPAQNAQSSEAIFRWRAPQAHVLANRLSANVFYCPSNPKRASRIRLGGLSFQNVNEPLRRRPVFAANMHLVRRTNDP
jgi:hypothetical protein